MPVIMEWAFKVRWIITWDQALFLFCWAFKIPAGKGKLIESLIQITHETSTAHFLNWLTFCRKSQSKLLLLHAFNYANFSRMGTIFYSPNTAHEWFRFKKRFEVSKIAVAGHGTRYVFRSTFSCIISIFAILLSQCLFAKRIEKKLI